MLGAGRPAAKPLIGQTRPLTKAEVLTTPRGKSPAVKTIRDSHHMVARLFALGLKPGQVAARSGYSRVRISILSGDPAFQELIATYRAMVNEEFKEEIDEFFSMTTANRNIAARLLNDKLADAEPDDLSIRELQSVIADAADRTGYPKRTVAVNLNVDFAARLDRAVKRSAEARALPPPTSNVIEGVFREVAPATTDAAAPARHAQPVPTRRSVASQEPIRRRI